MSSYLKILRTGAKMAAMLGRELADVYAIPAGQALTRYGIQQTEVRAQNAAAHLEQVQAALPEATAELGRLVVQTAQARHELAATARAVERNRQALAELDEMIERKRAELGTLGVLVEPVPVPSEPAPDGWTADADVAPPVASRG